MIKLNINEQTIEVEEGTTVLNAARSAGITIPTLCEHPHLSPYGGCRMCVVQVKGARLPATSCTLLAEEGMVIRTDTPEIEESRRSILKMLLYSYYDADFNPQAVDTDFTRLLKQYEVDVPRYMASRPRYAVDSDPNPFIRVDRNKCILCSRCVRACSEIQGRFVWSMAGRGYQAHIVAGANTDMIDARCESCGACVAYCPTGALSSKMMAGIGPGTTNPVDEKVTTTCTYCGVGCQLDLNIQAQGDQRKVVGVTSVENGNGVNGMHLCVKGRFGYDFIHHPDRLTRPRVRKYLLEGGPKPEGRGEWVEVDWDTALDITARKLAAARDTYGSNSVGVLTSAKCLNEENYLMNKFARQVVGTNSIDHCARL